MEKRTTGHILRLNLAAELTHGMCVSNLAFQVACEMGLPPETCHEMAVAGMVHDIGKLEIAKYLYSREPDPLTIEELKYVRTHSTMGYAILNERHYSEFVLQSILHHHENYDGSGYPSNLAGEEIPLGARILRVSDPFAALISDRPYRKAYSHETALKMILDGERGSFNPILLECLKRIHTKIRQEYEKTALGRKEASFLKDNGKTKELFLQTIAKESEDF